MLRVLIFSRDPGWYGGVVHFVELLRRSFSGSVISEHFLVGRRKHCSGFVCRITQPAVDMFRLIGVARSGRYDIFHLNPSLNGAALWRDGLFLRVLRFRKSGRVVVFFHGWDESTDRKIRNNRLLRTLFRLTFGYVDRFLVLSGAVKNSLSRLDIDPARITVTTTMFDAEEFRSAERQEGGPHVNLLFLSRFVREKGVYELLQSVRDIVRRYADVRLILAGDGLEMQAMRDWVAESGMNSLVEFTGYVRAYDKVQTMVRSDIYLLPSYTEGCPVSLLEAMAVGLPVVASAVGAIPELLRDGVNGFLLQKIDAASITAALEPLLADSELRRAIGRTNREMAWDKYASDRVTRSIENIYTEVTSIG